MPELPEVEVLVRHLAARLPGSKIRDVRVLAPGSLRGSTPESLVMALRHARFGTVARRGKHLLLTLHHGQRSRLLLAHLGMSGRLYLLPTAAPLPRHARIVIGLGRRQLVFEDVRRFGGITLDPGVLDRLGPEPLGPAFTTATFRHSLTGSRQPIKVRLLDQSVVAGLGNIYASEALFAAQIDPRTPSGALPDCAVARLRAAIRRVLSRAIRFGSTIPLEFGPEGRTDGLFYYGQSTPAQSRPDERLRVYDREGNPCSRCRNAIRRIVQAGRSTYFCPICQHRRTAERRQSTAEYRR
jgi:formamidopyrimidine-DNA glycosylase